ncbi:MAG TPA: alpha/beta fold hydrolase [Jatrophihabitans sp.]|jgi:ABC-2 type transport system ATP-binding protein|uniref:alpha/beta fold hydrolase n=1 Tax=Jatrophihabitans sp. TaxID=1932789 RepID=UPI002E080BBA|nr:alpha/beta fold hydrolase [Jatrophihabitans sp.]
MKLPALRERLRSRTVRIGLVVVLVLAIGGIVLGAVAASSVATRAQFLPGTPEGATPVRLDTTLYLPDSTPAPAILLSQGFGGSKTGLDSEAKTFAQDGYVVLTYSARGFGRSGGLIHFASPDYEIADARKLVDYLAHLPEVKKDAKGPQIAAAGSSYGGGLSLLLAAADPQVRAVSADITWNDLTHAFFPNGAGPGAGVFKKLWLGQLFGNAFSSGRNVLSSLAGGRAGRSESAAGGPSSVTCGRFAPSVCAAYQESAATGTPSAAMLRLMRQASPATVINRIKAPTQLVQGEQDSLFPLSEADANARGIAANGTPVSVVWRQGGHDADGGGTTDVINAGVSWFGKVFGGSLSGPQPFQFSEQAGIVSVETGSATEQTRRATGYPGIDGIARRTTTVDLAGPPQEVSAPAGGVPAAITSIPGLGGISNRFDNALALLPSSPGQTAYFSSSALTKAVSIAGAPSVRITVIPKSSGDAVLFAGLRDLSDDGTATLPSQLVTPLRLAGLRAGVPATVTIQLPSVVRNVLTKHRLVLSVATTDFAYAVPQKATTYTIALAGGTAAVTLPTVSGSPISAGHPLAWLIVGLLALLLVGGVVGGIIVRRRLVLKTVPELANTPISIEGLVKEYAGGYRAVDHVSFRVEHGQVVGLLGPNGAGKTTALRVLVGLITPTEGQIHVFGEPVVPGAPVLSRLGAFIEGPGFLPHLSGRDNLRLYWAATGRPIEEAEFETALDIAGLGASVDRKVKTYSHGMKQRLGIAQAMLGLPEVLVLDEPTNGLDPPQIAEMREVLQQYAQTGRTVVVSSHLLAEVEQTCTHVVVMHKGRLVASGSVAEIAGAGGMQLAVDDPTEAARVLAEVGIGSHLVPARRALEDVFLEMIGADE